MASLLPGDRRWGPTRKAGMTVLGKVPKPINLPSQRLENHGVDPNVEIVPKGTLTWGSRPASATANVWSSSSVSSPNTDGGGSSPSGLSGSLTRPSTATSDKSQQAVSAPWGPHSRPSSASRVLPSDQVQISVARPRSAETRHTGALRFYPGESAPEGSAWGPSRIHEKSAFASKPDTFNLSSGDFPTLGAEKSPKSSMPPEGDDSQLRPASASGRVNIEKEIVDFSLSGREALRENVNSWRAEAFPHDGEHHRGRETLSQGNVNTWKAEAFPHDNWRRDQSYVQHPHQNMGMMNPYPLDWPGPHMVNSPEGMWYRGPPPGGIFRPGGPGGYPIDPYLFYPQITARPIAYGPINGPSYPPQSAVFDGPVLGLAPPQPTLHNSPHGPKSTLQVAPFTAPASSKAEKEAEDGQRPRFKVLLKQHDVLKDSGAALMDGVTHESVGETPKLGPSTEAKKANDSGRENAEVPKKSMSFKQNSALMEKIEGLNSKARVMDGRSDRQGKEKEAHENVDVAEKSTSVLEAEKSGSSSPLAAAPIQGGHRKHHDYSKSRLSEKKGEEWRNKAPGSSPVVEFIKENPLIDCRAPRRDVSEKGVLDEGKISEKPLVSSLLDSADPKAQYGRMKEMARQRAQQLQREEEERTREQKARALAKLEELNRRTLSSSESSKEHVPNQEATVDSPKVNIPKPAKAADPVKSPQTSPIVSKLKTPVQNRRHHNGPEEKHDIISGTVMVGSIVVGTDQLAADSATAKKALEEPTPPAQQKKKTNRNRNRQDDPPRREKLAASALTVEEGSAKTAGLWKPQHPKKMTRNSSSGPEAAVVWAPVKPAENKKDVQPPTQTPVLPPEDTVEQAQSKSKRAEIERYIPKPAIVQEVSQPNASISPTVSTMEPKSVTESGKPSKNNGKANASWRRRDEVVDADGEGSRCDGGSIGGGNGADGSGRFPSSKHNRAPQAEGQRQSRGQRPPFRGHRASENWEPAPAEEAAPGRRMDQQKSQWQLKSTQFDGADRESTQVVSISPAEQKPPEKDKLAASQRRNRYQGQHGPNGYRVRGPPPPQPAC